MQLDVHCHVSLHPWRVFFPVLLGLGNILAELLGAGLAVLEQPRGPATRVAIGEEKAGRGGNPHPQGALLEPTLEYLGPAPLGGYDPMQAFGPEASSVLPVVVDQPLNHAPGIADEVFCLAVQVIWDIQPVDLGLEFLQAVFAKLARELEVVQIAPGL